MPLVLHMYYLSFLRLRKAFVDILDVDKGPCEVVSLLDASDPSCLCGEAGGAVEIFICWFNAGDFVDVVD